MKKLLLFISIIGLTMVSCKKETLACIQLDTSSANSGTPIVFTSCSEHSLSYIWSFTGPAGAPENAMQFGEPIFERAFTVPGVYTVELISYKKYSWLGDQSMATTTFTIN
ncbi:MAG: hypothetical protein ACI857_003017 [Arenicella sp.]